MSKPKPLYVGAGVVYPYRAKMHEQLERESRYGDSYNLSIPIEVDGQKCLMVPRNLPHPACEDRQDEGDAIVCTSAFKPHPKFKEQPAVIEQSVALLKEGTSHILKAPTGFGKTFVGSEIACQIGKRTLIVTTKEDIIGQWVDALSVVLSLPKEDIGVWQANRCDLGKPVTVGLVQSILKGPERYSEEAYQGYGLVIFDEVHRMGAETFSSAIWHLPAKLRLGLSATPTRKDGKDLIFQAHIGPVMVEAHEEPMLPKVFMVNSNWKVPIVYWYKKRQRLPHSPGKTGHVWKHMVSDHTRNKMMAGLIKQAYDAQRSVVVFSDTMAILHAIEQELEELVPEDDRGYYVGLQYYKGTKEEKRLQREQASVKPVTFATYSMASEATNCPWWDTALFATPRTDVVQICGRIRREFDGKKQPVVFDIVDGDSVIFSRYAQKRKQWYLEIGAPVEVVN